MSNSTQATDQSTAPPAAAPATQPAPAGTTAQAFGNRVVAEYNVATVIFHTDHVVAQMLKAAGLNPGDPGFVGTPEKVSVGVENIADIAAFQPGTRVRLTLETL